MNNACKHCGTPCKKQFCSHACSSAHRKSGKDFNCKHCNKTFYANAANIRKGAGQYCSEPCRRQYETEHATNYLKVGTTPIHRIVAEEMLGRPLAKGEVVHHKDGNKHNNTPSNLIVLPSQSEHMKTEFREGNIVISHEIAVRNGKLSVEARRRKKMSQENNPS